MKQVKRFLSLLLALCLALGFTPVVAAEAGGSFPFTDVDPASWYYEAVQYVCEKGMMSGTGSAAFSPDAATTRGMIVTVLHRLEGAPSVSGSAFTDVPSLQWYTDAVAWASANQIVSGYGNGMFGPGDAITREQVATILYRYAQYKGYDTKATGSVSDFSDSAQVSSYALDAMGWAVNHGLLSGVGNQTLAPKGNATRSEIAAILMRYCENIASSTAEEQGYTVTFQLNDGTGSVYDTQTVQAGALATKPANPSRGGYSFGGWYTEAEGGIKFDFTKEITADLTLYAHWSASSSAGGSSGESSMVYYYTVTFDPLASDASSVPPTQQVRSGGSVAEPAPPSRDGYLFTGWYADQACTQAYDFLLPVTANLTLYAKWVPSGGNSDGQHRVTFDLNNGSAGVYEVQTVADGGKAARPSNEPDRELYRFTGWYREPAAVTEYDFGSEVKGDLTLYAGWGAPDGSEGLYAASNTEDTIYSITGVHMEEDGSAVNVTLNTNSACALVVEFFTDEVSANWSPESMASNLGAEPLARVATPTPDYGELITVSIPVEAGLPEYYLIRARLVGLGGENGTADFCDPFVCINYTAKYAEFDAQTVDDFPDKNVINFDAERATNFGVLKDSVKLIASDEISNILTVTEIDIPGEIVPDHAYTLANPDAAAGGLSAGDAVYIIGTQHLFKVKAISVNGDGSITLASDKDTELTDFYDVLKVDMAPAEEEGVQPLFDIIDVDASLSASIDAAVNWEPIKDRLKVTGSVEGSAKVSISMTYDVHIFSDSYFECSIQTETALAAEIKAEVTIADNGDEVKNAQQEIALPKISIPTPIAGLQVYIKPTLPMEWSVSASASLKLTTTQKTGFEYDTYSGRRDISEKTTSLSLELEGKAEIKAGPKISVGIQFIGETVSAEISAQAGVKLTATVEIGSDDLLNQVDSKHACELCVSGEAKWFVEGKVKLSYNITNILRGDIFDITIFNIEGWIAFLKSNPGKFFFSIINSPDSPFGGNFKFGGGSCTNETYRTEIQVAGADDSIQENVPVTVRKQGDAAFEKTGNSTYVVYLYDGIYSASANVDGASVSKSFVTKGGRQTVILSPSSGDKQLAGKIVDSANNSAIEGASIKISKDGLVVASVQSGGNGEFTLPLPEGTFLVEVTKQGYIPFSVYQSVESDQAATQMQTIGLISGEGMGGFRGIITDAVTDQPVEGVTLQLRSGWQNSSYGDVIKTLTTDSGGAFRYETLDVLGTGIILGLACGNYTLTASKDGYIGASFNIIVLPGATDANPQQNVTMAPAATQGDTYRIVLTWGENPRDLDSHVVGALTSGNSFHVYFGHKSEYDGDMEVCNLDLDDTTSYGPETITLNVNTSAPYYYYIHRYAGSGTVASSGAQIKVYHGSAPVRTFHVPTGFGDGDYWNVFAIVDGQIKVQNTITGSPDISYAGAAGLMLFSLDELEEKEPVPASDSEGSGSEPDAGGEADHGEQAGASDPEHPEASGDSEEPAPPEDAGNIETDGSQPEGTLENSDPTGSGSGEPSPEEGSAHSAV